MTEQESLKYNWQRMLRKVVVFVVVGVIFLFLVFYGLSWYGDWSFSRDIKRLTEEANRPYLEDTYGGKTPKETLELFITAVEKEDFDLASKYFVLSKQEEWRGRLANGNKEKLSGWLNLLKLAQNKGSLWESNFQMEVKSSNGGANLMIDFIKYPRGIWKIQEI